MSETIYIDAKSARFGMLGGLFMGFALGFLWNSLYITGGFLFVSAIYCLHRSKNADLKVANEIEQ